MKCLAVDIGNTSTCLSLVTGESVLRFHRLSTHRQTGRKVSEILRKTAGAEGPENSIIASVVPRATALWIRELRRLTGRPPLVVSHRLKLGVQLRYSRPETLGADRLVNVSGAMAQYEPPLIVADFGTAATFDVVSADGHFVGGVIAPGPNLLAGAMADHTALLPRISLKGYVPRMGRGTRSAMRIGLAVGYAGMTGAIVDHLKSYPGMRRAVLCATGGYAEWVVQQSGMPWKMDPFLTMRGLGRICALNTAPNQHEEKTPC